MKHQKPPSSIPSAHRCLITWLSPKRFRNEILIDIEDKFIGISNLYGDKKGKKYLWFEIFSMSIDHVKHHLYIMLIFEFLSRILK